MSDKATTTQDPTPAERLRSRVAAAIAEDPWLITEPKLLMLEQIVMDRAKHGRLEEESIIRPDAMTASPEDQRGYELRQTSAGQIAVVNIFGVLSKRMGFFDRISGGVSTERLATVLRSIPNDTGIKGTVLNIDSPGGAVNGTEDAGNAVWELRQRMPVYAIANDVMASGAFWIGSQANRVFLHETAAVGSLGVVSVHYDRSVQAERYGVKPTVLTTSKHKAVGNEFSGLDDDARSVIMERMNAIHEQFLAAVSRGLGLSTDHVRAKIGDGRIFTGRQAIAVGAAHEIGNLPQVIAKLAGDLSSANSTISTGVSVVSTSTTTNEVDQPTQTAAAPIEDAAKLATASDEAVKAERARCLEIRSAVKASGLDDNLADQFIEAGISADASKVRLFELQAERNRAGQIGGTKPNETPLQKEGPDAKAKAEYAAQREVYERMGISEAEFIASWKAGMPV